MSVLLRRATPADLDAIMQLERATFADDAWPVDAMRRELESEHGYYLVAVDGETDAPGAALFGYGGLLAPTGSGQGDVQTIAVEPARRGTGLGRALMDALLAEARRRDAEFVFLEVRADNPVARALYESLGFVQIGVRPRYYRGGIDAVLMRLELTAARPAPADRARSAAVGAEQLAAGAAAAGDGEKETR